MNLLVNIEKIVRNTKERIFQIGSISIEDYEKIKELFDLAISNIRTYYSYYQGFDNKANSGGNISCEDKEARHMLAEYIHNGGNLGNDFEKYAKIKEWLNNSRNDMQGDGYICDKLESMKITSELVENMCISYRHDFGLLDNTQQDELRFECKEWLRAYQNNRKIND